MHQTGSLPERVSVFVSMEVQVMFFLQGEMCNKFVWLLSVELNKATDNPTDCYLSGPYLNFCQTDLFRVIFGKQTGNL